MKDLVTSAEAPAPAGPYSAGLRVGDLIFLAGQGGFHPDTDELVSDDIAEQTAQTFRNIEVLLQAAGATLDDVVSCLVHLRDLAQVADFNASYEKQFPGPVKPVRTTVRADLLADMRVEVTVIASRPKPEGAH
jgi:reactive intermediate/imine deaminase